VRASEAFTVVGSRSGYVHPLIVNPDKSDPAKANSCVPDPALTRSQRALQIGRIPLNPPACGDPDPLKTDPITGEILPGNPPATMTFEANPCTVTVPQFENLKTFPDPTTCVPVIPDPSVGARDATAIRFRNRGLKVTLVDPFYIGDQVCPVDRKGSLSAAFANAKIPLVFPGYQISFHQTSGYSPLSLPNVSSSFAPAFPVKVVEGPTGSIWVIDDGDSPGSQFTAPTRGQVYRIESINLGLVNLLQ
jgi:hypothetical protein